MARDGAADRPKGGSVSVVTNAILAPGILEDDDLVDVVNRVMNDPSDAGTHRWQEFKRLDSRGEAIGGYKALEADLWLAAFNHRPPEVIARAIARVHWQFPSECQLFVKPQDADSWAIGNVDQIRKGLFPPP